MKTKNSRKLQQDEDALPTSTLSPTMTYSQNPLLPPPINVSSSPSTAVKSTFKSNTAFDSSMALTILVLLTALFFMGFFSVYFRRFSDDGGSVPDARRRRSPPPSSSSYCPRKGLDPSTVGSLPLIPYGGGAKHPIDCVICLSEFDERETVKMIPYCRHVFHPKCIDTWLASHVSCPLCRSTRMSAPNEVSFRVLEENDYTASELGRRSTVDEGDTWREVGAQG